jgi:hypothetical protein
VQVSVLRTHVARRVRCHAERALEAMT